MDTPIGQCRLTIDKNFLNWPGAVTTRTPPGLLWLHGLHLYMETAYPTALLLWQPPGGEAGLLLTNSTVQGSVIGLWATAPVFVAGVLHECSAQAASGMLCLVCELCVWMMETSSLPVLAVWALVRPAPHLQMPALCACHDTDRCVICCGHAALLRMRLQAGSTAVRPSKVPQHGVLALATQFYA